MSELATLVTIKLPEEVLEWCRSIARGRIEASETRTTSWGNKSGYSEYEIELIGVMGEVAFARWVQVRPQGEWIYDTRDNCGMDFTLPDGRTVDVKATGITPHRKPHMMVRPKWVTGSKVKVRPKAYADLYSMAHTFMGEGRVVFSRYATRDMVLEHKPKLFNSRSVVRTHVLPFDTLLHLGNKPKQRMIPRPPRAKKAE